MNIIKILASSAVAVGLAMGSALAQDVEQDGLVNIAVEDTQVQVPVSVAANVCGVEVSVLVSDFVGTDKVVCTIDQETAAENNIEY